jgi:hypothetical protein
MGWRNSLIPRGTTQVLMKHKKEMKNTENYKIEKKGEKG